ncbi:MAG: hypothetical protein QOK48_2132 [Blastocatellia bacterium]|jgi:hypothetical protein|nr:hypothetical protein [Blastocatellia bacterium]
MSQEIGSRKFCPPVCAARCSRFALNAGRDARAPQADSTISSY